MLITVQEVLSGMGLVGQETLDNVILNGGGVFGIGQLFGCEIDFHVFFGTFPICTEYAVTQIIVVPSEYGQLHRHISVFVKPKPGGLFLAEATHVIIAFQEKLF